MLIEENLLKRARQKFGKRKLSETVNRLIDFELKKDAKIESCAGILRHLKLKPFKREELDRH